MLTLATEWADKMRTGRLSKADSWLAIMSTIMRTLAYPLSALNLTEAQYDDLLRPILMYGLPAMGICRHFARDIVFAPKLYRGTGLKHLYTQQEISRLLDIMSHTHQNSTTGSLYTSSFELLLVEVGLGTIIHSIPSPLLQYLATDSLIKSTCLFLNHHWLQLCHTIQLLPDRQNNTHIMEGFLNAGATTDELIRLNKCRLFLSSYYISDIATGNGSKITEDA